MGWSVRFRYAAAVWAAVIFPLVANGEKCTEGFILETTHINITGNCKLNSLGAEFAWNFDNKSRQLDVAFGARLESATAWLAWGLNPEGPHMVGTRALIGIRHDNGVLGQHKYSITDATKRHCQLLPSDDIGLNVTNFTFDYLHKLQYYVIQATIFLPDQYNASSAHVVWEIGESAADGEPIRHPMSLDNLDSTQTINLVSGKVLSYNPNHRNRLRTAHGVLNIVGWGIFLPSGAIVARYFRSHPKKVTWWGAVHISCQTIGFILGSIGWGIGLWLGQASKHYTFTTHRILAIIIFTFTTIQMTALRLKPKSTDEYRVYWNMYHLFLGYSLLGVIVANEFQGIKIMEIGHTTHSWRWSYIGVLGILGVVALILELYSWLTFIKHDDENKTTESSKKQTSPSPSSKATVPAPLETPQLSHTK